MTDLWKPYKHSFPFSYAMGPFVGMEMVQHRPEQVRAILASTLGMQNAGVLALRDLAMERQWLFQENDRWMNRLAPKGNTFSIVAFEKWSDRLDSSRPHIVLHQPSDSGNVGTIARTALGFGIHDLALIAPCVDPFDPRTVRASMGALASLRVCVFDDYGQYRSAFLEREIYCFMLQGSMDLSCVKPNQPWSIVLGNEASGLPDAFSELGTAVRIPHGQEIDSLNLAVAASIGMWHFTRATH